MGEAIKHGFANLTNFAGRDSRTLFWWWVLLIVVITFGLSFISGIVFTAGAMGTAFQGATSGVDQDQLSPLQRRVAGHAVRVGRRFAKLNGAKAVAAIGTNRKSSSNFDRFPVMYRLQLDAGSRVRQAGHLA